MEYYVGLTILAIALGLLFRALVNKRVGNEPYCRRCKFELSGLPYPKVCPECGTDLQTHRAIRIGKGRVRVRPLWWGIGLLALGGVFVGIDAMNRSGFINLTSMKPVRMLYAEAYLLDDRRASVATLEIQGRAVMGAMQAGWDDRLLQIALDRHEQTWRSFPNAQWQVITDAVSARKVDSGRVAQIVNDAGGKLEIVNPGWNGQAAYPGEHVMVPADVKWRAGEAQAWMAAPFQEGFFLVTTADIQPIGLRTKIGSLSDTQSNMWIETPLEKSNAQVQFVTPFMYRHDLTPSFQIPADMKPGTYRAKLVVRAHRFASQIDELALQEEGMSAIPELVECKVLEETFSFTVAETGSQDPKPITGDHFGKASNTNQRFMKFRLIALFEQHGSLYAEYEIARLSWLSEDTGLAGVLVFEQDGKEIKSPPFCITHNRTVATNMFGTGPIPVVNLDGFHSGPVNVRYEYYPGIARNYRHEMSRVLKGPVQLDSFAIPEDVPNRKPRSPF